jgi:AbrB family looped-hinge helix DNA binding protein
MKKSSGATNAANSEDETGVGFSTVDEKGRIALPKAVRSALGVRAGSSLAYIVLDDAVLFIPQDAHLAELQQQAIQTLTEAGLTVEDLLDQLPQARDAVTREAYSPEFLAKLRKLRIEHPDIAGAVDENASQAQQGE